MQFNKRGAHNNDWHRYKSTNTCRSEGKAIAPDTTKSISLLLLRNEVYSSLNFDPISESYEGYAAWN